MYLPNETRKWPSIKDVAKSAIAESTLLWEFGPSMSKLGCDNCVQKEMKATGRRKRKRGAGGNLLDNANFWMKILTEENRTSCARIIWNGVQSVRCISAQMTSDWTVCHHYSYYLYLSSFNVECRYPQ